MRHFVSCGLEAENSHAERVLRVRYARMAADPAGFMSEVLGFLGVGQSDAPASFLKTKVINSSFASERPVTAGVSARAHVKRWDARRRQTYDSIAGQLHRELFGWYPAQERECGARMLLRDAQCECRASSP